MNRYHRLSGAVGVVLLATFLLAGCSENDRPLDAPFVLKALSLALSIR